MFIPRIRDVRDPFKGPSASIRERKWPTGRRVWVHNGKGSRWIVRLSWKICVRCGVDGPFWVTFLDPSDTTLSYPAVCPECTLARVVTLSSVEDHCAWCGPSRCVHE